MLLYAQSHRQDSTYHSLCHQLWSTGWNEDRNVLFNDALITFYLRLYGVRIWLRTILIVRKETHCRHIGYSYRLTARVLLYAPSHRQDNTYHSLCYTSRGALARTRNSSMGPPHEGTIRRCIAPWANALPLSYVPLLGWNEKQFNEGSIQQSITRWVDALP